MLNSIFIYLKKEFLPKCKFVQKFCGTYFTTCLINFNYHRKQSFVCF
jgi:hypothetical protein